jgi:hypothetical protein
MLAYLFKNENRESALIIGKSASIYFEPHLKEVRISFNSFRQREPNKNGMVIRTLDLYDSFHLLIALGVFSFMG